jgi:hypothetical protein
MSGLIVRSGDGIFYDIVLGEPYEVVRGSGVSRPGDLISFKKIENRFCFEFFWFLNNIEQGPCNNPSRFNAVFRPCNHKSLADMLKECLE